MRRIRLPPGSWLVFVQLLGIATAQRYPSPGVVFSTEFEDAGPEGIAILENEAIFVTVNQQWIDDGFAQSWVHKLDSSSGEILQSRLLDQDGSNVGACTLLLPGESGTNRLIINPGKGNSDSNVGIQAVRTSTLQSLWSSNIVREADRGVPPIISPLEDIVYYSISNGLAVLDMEGRTQWATTTVKTAQIAVTRTFVYAVDQTEREKHPLNVYSLKSGALKGSTEEQEEGSTTAGVVLSPDERFAYTVRSGMNGGLYRNRANFLFYPSEVVTTEVSSAHRFGPLLSPDGNATYIVNPLQVLIEAYSLSEGKTLWRSTFYPTIPPVLSQDGLALYTQSTSGDIVRVDTGTGKIVWSYNTLPDGFLATSMILSGDDSMLLLTGQVFESHTGYAFAFLTDGATFGPTVSPTITRSPTSAPVLLKPSRNNSDTTVSTRGENEETLAPSKGSSLSASLSLVGVALWSIGFSLL